MQKNIFNFLSPNPPNTTTNFGVFGSHYLQGVPRRMLLLSGFEFLTLGGVFLGVKNKSKNFGNQKILGCLAKF